MSSLLCASGLSIRPSYFPLIRRYIIMFKASLFETYVFLYSHYRKITSFKLIFSGLLGYWWKISMLRGSPPPLEFNPGSFQNPHSSSQIFSCHLPMCSSPNDMVAGNVCQARETAHHLCSPLSLYFDFVLYIIQGILKRLQRKIKWIICRQNKHEYFKANKNTLRESN